MVKPFDDFGKTVKKLLCDDYVTGRKVEVKTVTKDGVSFTASHLVSITDGIVDGSLSWKYRVFGSLFTTKVLQSNGISTEAVFEKLGVKGLKATLFGSYINEEHSDSAKLEYISEPMSVSTIADVQRKLCVTSLAVGYKDVACGFDATYSADNQSVVQYNAGATLTQKDSELTVFGLEEFNYVKVTFSQLVSRGFSIAAEASYNRMQEEMSMITGVRYEVDTTTIKMKADDSGGVSFAYITRVDPAILFTMSASTNVKDMEKGNRFGLAITIDQPT